MDDTTAIDILTKMLEKDSVTDDEKKALRTGIGMLAWSKLMEGRMKSIKKSRDRKLQE